MTSAMGKPQRGVGESEAAKPVNMATSSCHQSLEIFAISELKRLKQYFFCSGKYYKVFLMKT